MTDPIPIPKPRRVDTVKLRLRPEEASAWRAEAKAVDKTLSNLIRERMGAAQGTQITPKRQRLTKKADPALLTALARVGTNLNQIAKWVNTQKSEADAIEVIGHLITIERILFSYRPAAQPQKMDDEEAHDAD